MIKKILKSYLRGTLLSLLILVGTAGCQDLKPAIKAYETGEYDQAIQLINQYLQQKPTDEQAYYYLGNCYFKKGEWDSSIEQYKKALGVKSKYWEAQYQLGRAYYKKGMYDEAEKTFQEGLKSKEREEFYDGLGLVQMATGKLTEADFSFRKAIAFDEKNAEFQKHLGDVNLKKGVLVIAVQSYENALKLDSSMIEVRLNLAKAYLGQVRFNDAMNEFKTVIRLDPKNKDAYYAMGDIYMLDGKHYPEARIIYEEYLKLDPQDSKAQMNLGVSYYFLSRMLPSLVVDGDTLSRSDMVDRAIQHMEKSTSMNPEEPQIYLYLGKSYQEKGEFTKALQAFESYEKILIQKNHEWKPEDADFWVSKGQVQAQIGDSASLEQAIISLKKAIELDSTKTTAYTTLGTALFDQEKYAEAIPFFQKKIETDPSNAYAYYYLASCYLKLEKYKEAVEPLTKVVELKPDNAAAYELLAKVYFNLNNFEKAKEAYLEVLRLDPSKCDINYIVGYCFLQMNNPAAAVPYAKKTVACFPKNVNYLLMLAKSLEISKNTDEAYQYYLKVLEIDPKNKDAIDGRDRIDMQKF
jgi:tetratricopeptide (TPR) repeat protein